MYSLIMHTIFLAQPKASHPRKVGAEHPCFHMRRFHSHARRSALRESSFLSQDLGLLTCFHCLLQRQSWVSGAPRAGVFTSNSLPPIMDKAYSLTIQC